jgi:hypothetical protein
MCPKRRDKFSEVCVTPLIEAQAFIADELVTRAGRRRDNLLPQEMELWKSSFFLSFSLDLSCLFSGSVRNEV